MFLYTNNELLEMKKTIQLIAAVNKTLGINLRMEVKGLYNENYKILKEIKDDSNK